ncbi:MAG: serine protease [Nitrospirales bacterium]|nr:serine protease [Nitrospirales bacterium]
MNVNWWMVFFIIVSSFSPLPFPGIAAELVTENNQTLNKFSIPEVRKEIDRRIRLGSFSPHLGKPKSLQTEGPSQLSSLNDADLAKIAEGLGGRKAIYGTDNRMDWWEFQKIAAIKKLAEATVVLVDRKDLTLNDNGKYYLKTVTLQKKKEPLCPGEKFEFQRTSGYCSGTLIEKNLVLTAGHCIREISGESGLPFLQDIAVVFGFRVFNQNGIGPTVLEKNQVYFVKNESVGGTSSDSRNDWALIKLTVDVDQMVAEPSSNIQEGMISNFTKVFVIGHPDGLPVKFAPEGEITQNIPDRAYFVATLDAFGGNSGSGVYNQETNAMVGILTHGGIDYSKPEGESCFKANLCPSSGCNGEFITRLANVKIP